MLPDLEWYQTVSMAPAWTCKYRLPYDNPHKKLGTIAVDLLPDTGLEKARGQECNRLRSVVRTPDSASNGFKDGHSKPASDCL